MITRNTIHTLFTPVYKQIFEEYLPSEKIYNIFVNILEDRVFVEVNNPSMCEKQSHIERKIQRIAFQIELWKLFNDGSDEYRKILQENVSGHIRDYYEWAHHIPQEDL